MRWKIHLGFIIPLGIGYKCPSMALKVKQFTITLNVMPTCNFLIYSWAHYFIYIHTYIHTYLHTYIHTYIIHKHLLYYRDLTHTNTETDNASRRVQSSSPLRPSHITAPAAITSTYKAEADLLDLDDSTQLSLA